MDEYNLQEVDDCHTVVGRSVDYLTEFTRTGDIMRRYGGEEFLVAFPNTEEQDAFLSKISF